MGCILCSVSGREWGVYYAVSQVRNVVYTMQCLRYGMWCILCSVSGREWGVYYAVSQVGNGVYTMQCLR